SDEVRAARAGEQQVRIGEAPETDGPPGLRVRHGVSRLQGAEQLCHEAVRAPERDPLLRVGQRAVDVDPVRPRVALELYIRCPAEGPAGGDRWYAGVIEESMCAFDSGERIGGAALVGLRSRDDDDAWLSVRVARRGYHPKCAASPDRY